MFKLIILVHAASEIEMNGKKLEDVNEYSYLENIVSGSGGADEDVTGRIKKANVAFVQLYRVLEKQEYRNEN
jgi:hypothetical protein